MKPIPITVTELNRYIKDKVAEDEFLNNVLVKGEISNFKHHYTGHMYFTLKDENSLIKCIMFKTMTATLNFLPKDGTKVIIFGSIGVFERDGVYQIYCKAIQEDGVGSLHIAFEKLKNKLEKEGLFDEHTKRKIPFMPKVIGVLTSNTGAVIKDIINVGVRRNPNINIRLFPVPVQGEGAGEKIADALKIMNDKKLADVIILARGGGSLEDLWAFNEEVVARAIHHSEIPIISAIGHETDYTISDFVSDLRAPTPSAAAELAIADTSELEYIIGLYKNRLKIFLKRKIEVIRLRLEKCMNSRIYKNPLQRVNDEYLNLDNLVKRLENVSIKKLKDSKLVAAKVITKLDTLSPLKTLTRGYCITQIDGSVVTKAKELKKDMEIDIRFQDGDISAIVK